jgi:transaldolase
MVPDSTASNRTEPLFEDRFIALGRPEGHERRLRLESAPLLASLKRAGTSHVYADTADAEELRALLAIGEDAAIAEVDGNTVNQPLVHKVLSRLLAQAEPARWAEELCARRAGLTPAELAVFLYTIVCGRIGNDIVRSLASSRLWEVSLQLHMRLGADPEQAKQVARVLCRMVPSAIVKVPFTPQEPACFLVARDLEREGIPVNFTSTFSARQVVAVALLANVTRTNVFMGRLNQGLKADLLGEHVDLEAQRALLGLRRDAGVRTQLIVASLRDWKTFVRVAGCDVFTAPCDAIRDFLEQTEIAPSHIQSQLETSYEYRLGIAEEVLRTLGAEWIARLYRVEGELAEFLLELRKSSEFAALDDGDELFRRFDQAGFGDLFHSPTATEWREIRASKLPNIESAFTRAVPLDTLYSLLADADFEKHQEEMDRMLEPFTRGGEKRAGR